MRVRRHISVPALLACLYAAASLILAPLGQALHVALASHGHRHCPVHGVVEDVPAAAHRAAPAVSDGVGLREAPAPTRHVPCRIMNADSAPTPPLVARQGVRVAAARVPPAALRDASPLGCPSLILIAPKNSPPTTDCPA
jgi:hypothetical protein